MKDGAYADKGVGHLHLKTVSNKTQLIVRADTSLGNVLLNIVINSAMPVAKQGKNNVVISCVPNPPIDEANSDKVIYLIPIFRKLLHTGFNVVYFANNNVLQYWSELGTANLHAIPQPQNCKRCFATANPQVCGNFSDFRKCTLHFRKLRLQYLLLFCPE